MEQGTGRVTGVIYIDTATGQEGSVSAHDTVLATGGFANDRTNTSLLAKHRPDLVSSIQILFLIHFWPCCCAVVLSCNALRATHRPNLVSAIQTDSFLFIPVWGCRRVVFCLAAKHRPDLVRVPCTSVFEPVLFEICFLVFSLAARKA